MAQIIMPTPHPDDRYFRTPNLYLAVILFAQGSALLNVDRTDPTSCQFVFPKSFELEETVERFRSKKPIFVEARKLILAWKTLRAKSKGEPFQPIS